LDEEKSKHGSFGPRKMILLSSIFGEFAEVGTRCNKDVHLLEESVVNRI
jgi:hypothetical protein